MFIKFLSATKTYFNILAHFMFGSFSANQHDDDKSERQRSG